MEKYPTLSVCTIVKDEQPRIERFFEALIDFADEIVIVDTGSSDGTRKVIEEYQQAHPLTPILFKTYVAEGGFHYGAAKNFSINHATSDYVLILDADERPSAQFKIRLKTFLREQQPVVASVVRKDELVPHLIDYPERIIRRESLIRYDLGPEAKVHEQLSHAEIPLAFTETLWHEQRWNHYLVRPQRIFFQLELQVDRTPKTKSFFGHVLRGVWYFWYRFRKLYFTRQLYKDGSRGFKYAFLRALDAFLIEFFVGLRPTKQPSYPENQ